MKSAFLTHPLFLQHDTGPGHPERPARLRAIIERLTETGFRESWDWIEPPPRPDVYDAIRLVHRPDYVEKVRRLSPETGYVALDSDTVMSPKTLAAAEMAVAAVLTAVDEVIAGRHASAFCAVRPPGHHAEADRAMGFCFFNNVAVAARYAQKKHGLRRVLIVDWDVHHGNGTQNIFYDDPTVFYFSTHQFPFYPATGSMGDRGAGAGDGFTLNCPLAAGSGDAEILDRFKNGLIPAAEAFRPELILISAGFDAHRDDPLANLRVTEEGYAELTRIVRGLAGRHAGGRLVSALEGGYDLAALGRSVEAHLRAFVGRRASDD